MTFNKECLESSRAALEAHQRASAQFNKKGQEELWSGYVHWSVLQAPFTPYVEVSPIYFHSSSHIHRFIVMFCNAIQKADTCDVSADLNSLSEFVASLESCRTISEGADKLYKMCHLFLRVARLYVLAKTQDAASRSQSVAQTNQPNFYNTTTTGSSQLDLNAMAQFDPFLSALGLLPDSGWSMEDYNMSPPNVGGIQAFAQQPTVENNGANPSQTGLGFGPPGGNQNAMQDWFSGSRYLMNLMEPGDDMMPDVDL